MILSVSQVNDLLRQPGSSSPKEIRDKAMLELLYATGIRVSELIHLKLADVNMQVGYITCRDGSRERMVPFGRPAKKALTAYLEKAREELLKGKDSDLLFTNCSGGAMSRQGFWKIIKSYGEKAGDYRGHHASHPAAFLCRPSHPQRGGHPRGPGHARPCGQHHGPDVRGVFQGEVTVLV